MPQTPEQQIPHAHIERCPRCGRRFSLCQCGGDLVGGMWDNWTVITAVLAMVFLACTIAVYILKPVWVTIPPQ